MNNNGKDKLSVNRFRDRDINTLTNDEFRDYILSNLMQKTIQVLEVSIHQDRVFNRARYEVFTAFWEARDNFEKRTEGKE